MNKVLHTLVLSVCVSAVAVIFLWGSILLVGLAFTTLGVLAGIMTGLFIMMFVIMFCAALEVD